MTITDMQMRQRDVAALDAKYTKELADAKAENDALRDDGAAGRRRLHIQEAVTVDPVHWPPPPPAWMMQPPRLANTTLSRIITPETVICRQLEGTQYINEQGKIELPISLDAHPDISEQYALSSGSINA